MTYKSATRPHCRSCGEQIAKRTASVWIRLPGSGMARQDGSYWYSIDTDVAPTTVAECQRLVNQNVVSVRRSADNKTITRFSTWDGESWEDEFFCSSACAQAFGRFAAKHAPTLRTQAYADAIKQRDLKAAG